MPMYAEVKLDEVNKDGKDALWLAAEKGHIDIVKVLIEKLRRNPKLKQRIELALEASKLYGHDAVERVLNQTLTRLRSGAGMATL